MMDGSLPYWEIRRRGGCLVVRAGHDDRARPRRSGPQTPVRHPREPFFPPDFPV